MATTTQEALQIGTIMPNFTVDDLQRSITFYEALGFEATHEGMKLHLPVHA